MVAYTSKINDLMFKELIKRGYSLEGNTRIFNIADSKLWYLNPEQAQAFLDLENSEDYHRDVIQKEIDLMNENLSPIFEAIKDDKINIIDLGCGDGKKAVLVIQKLKGQTKIRYCPIDISGYMVDKALKRIRNTDVEEVVEFQWNISDFENIENIASLLRQGDYKRTFTLLLGNTLGNFEINELLYQIRSSMKSGDYLLIGNGLDNRNEEEILKSYNTEEVNNFLVHIPLNLGLQREDVQFGARFKNSRVEIYYTLKRDKTIEFQNKKVHFSRGDQMIVAVSYKYNKKDFEAFLKIYFDNVKLYTSEDDSFALAFCKK